MYRPFTALLVLLLAGSSRAQQTPVALQLEQVNTGLTRIVDISHCGDDRLFLVLQAGIIRVRDGAGTLLTTPFMDITDRVNDGGNEQGLLGLAFDPDYANNGRFYVCYTAGSGNGSERISRFSVTSDPNVADPASEEILYNFADVASNHNGGDIDFGPDGYLYAGFGDGGSGNDPWNHAQDMGVPFGKILRFDVSGTSGWSVPPTGLPSPLPLTRCRRFASGLRNPWRWGFDSENGDIYIGDVGQNAVEEVDFWPAGDLSGPNFGWRCYEANNTGVSGELPTGEQLCSAHSGPPASQPRLVLCDRWPSLSCRYVLAHRWPLHLHRLLRRAILLPEARLGRCMGTYATPCFGHRRILLHCGERRWRTLRSQQQQRPSLSDQGALHGPAAHDHGGWRRFRQLRCRFLPVVPERTSMPGETGQSLSPTSSGNYFVLATVNTGCLLASDTLWFSPLEITDIRGLEMTIRPVPADDRIWVDAQLPAASRIQLIDAQGRVVADQRNTAAGPTSIAVGGVAGGAYVLRVLGSDGALLGRRPVTVKH